MIEFDVNTLARDLRKMAVETGHISVACLGCGYEHSCSIHGCALMFKAANALEQSQNLHESKSEVHRDDCIYMHDRGENV